MSALRYNGITGSAVRDVLAAECMKRAEPKRSHFLKKVFDINLSKWVILRYIKDFYLESSIYSLIFVFRKITNY